MTTPPPPGPDDEVTGLTFTACEDCGCVVAVRSGDKGFDHTARHAAWHTRHDPARGRRRG